MFLRDFVNHLEDRCDTVLQDLGNHLQDGGDTFSVTLLTTYKMKVIPFSETVNHVQDGDTFLRDIFNYLQDGGDNFLRDLINHLWRWYLYLRLC
jgi:2-polyprenyl-3-methyl-5-hydroxy-6-metoxy-1,4-benzoquinol methylase